MGNALDFLNDKENRDKYRRGRHNNECKNKIDEFLVKNETTKCPDLVLIKHGRSGKSRVNEIYEYRPNLKGIRSRMHAKKEVRKCKSCLEDFKPIKLRRPPTIAEREKGIINESIYCKLCTAKGKKYREILEIVGGLEEYISLNEEMMNVEEIRKQDSLRVLYSQDDIRTKLNKPSKTLDRQIEDVIEKAYTQNEHNIVHYEFDF